MIKNHTELAEERSKAIALIHMVENDNCPNTVLEALAQGIPVIHDVKGGTKEIVQWFGHQIVDPTPAKVAMGCFMMWTCASAWQDKWMDEFDQTLKIDVVAKKYETFIERISYG
jgi:glycosyltransferase involved in cell wall biosynthesis